MAKRPGPIYHPCAMKPDCKEMIPIDHLMCRPDWALVPGEIKSRVNLTYRRRSADWQTYRDAVRDAKAAVRRARPMAEQPAPTPLDGCRYCGLPERGSRKRYPHAQRWTTEAGWHVWTPPTQDQIKQRMKARRTWPNGTGLTHG